MKHIFTVLCVYLCFAAQVFSQQQTTPDRDPETRIFRIENFDTGMQEKALWNIVNQYPDLLAGCSLNQLTGQLKLDIYPGADLVKILKLFNDHHYTLSFTDADGTKKGYDAATGQIIRMRG